MSKVRFLGLDVHADTIAVAVAERGGEVRSLGTIPNRLQAQGLQAHRNALRQTRSELLLSPVPRCRRGILALVVRGFPLLDNIASVSAPG